MKELYEVTKRDGNQGIFDHLNDKRGSKGIALTASHFLSHYICSVSRIIAIDYGLKRTGLAWTDPLQIIASGLETVPTPDLLPTLKSLVEKNPVEGFLLGWPTRLDGSDTHSTEAVRKFHKQLNKTFSGQWVELWEEQFTSKMAVQAMVQSGMSKKKRREKGMVDRMSATLILQEYLESNTIL